MVILKFKDMRKKKFDWCECDGNHMHRPINFVLSQFLNFKGCNELTKNAHKGKFMELICDRVIN